MQIVFSVPQILYVLYWDDVADPIYRTLLQFYPPFNFNKMVNDITTKSNVIVVNQLPPSNTCTFPFLSLQIELLKHCCIDGKICMKRETWESSSFHLLLTASCTCFHVFSF